MKTLLKSLGGIILLAGVVILLIPSYQGIHNNTILFTGLGIILLGYLVHIILHKKIE